MSAEAPSARPSPRAAVGSRRAPMPLGWAIRRARELADPVAIRAARPRTPVPPRRLRARTGAPGIRQFLDGGVEAASELQAALTSVGRRLDQFGSVLDLGCGSGRVLPHVAQLAPDAACTGCDVDAAAVGWASSHHRSLHWLVSSFDPPLPVQSQSFELVYAISVFSHLDQSLQDRWLSEMTRILKPGGVALLTVHGAHAFEQFRTGAVTTAWCEPRAFARAPLGEDEFLFTPYRRSIWNEGELPGVRSGYGLAFHGEQYLRSHWGRWLKVEAVLGRAMTLWQDIAVCVS